MLIVEKTNWSIFISVTCTSARKKGLLKQLQKTTREDPTPPAGAGRQPDMADMVYNQFGPSLRSIKSSNTTRVTVKPLIKNFWRHFWNRTDVGNLCPVDFAYAGSGSGDWRRGLAITTLAIVLVCVRGVRGVDFTVHFNIILSTQDYKISFLKNNFTSFLHLSFKLHHCKVKCLKKKVFLVVGLTGFYRKKKNTICSQEL